LVLYCTVVVPYDMSFEPPKVTNHEVLFQMLPWVRVEIMLCGATKGSLSSVIYMRLVLIFEIFPRAWVCGASTLELKFFSYVKWWKICDFFSSHQLLICKYNFDREDLVCGSFLFGLKLTNNSRIPLVKFAVLR
jgi:hypothetical protein